MLQLTQIVERLTGPEPVAAVLFYPSVRHMGSLTHAMEQVAHAIPSARFFRGAGELRLQCPNGSELCGTLSHDRLRGRTYDVAFAPLGGFPRELRFLCEEIVQPVEEQVL